MPVEILFLCSIALSRLKTQLLGLKHPIASSIPSQENLSTPTHQRPLNSSAPAACYASGTPWTFLPVPLPRWVSEKALQAPPYPETRTTDPSHLWAWSRAIYPLDRHSWHVYSVLCKAFSRCIAAPPSYQSGRIPCGLCRHGRTYWR